MSEFDDPSGSEEPERCSVVKDDTKAEIGDYIIIRYEGIL